MGGQVAVVPQQHREGDGGGELEQELGPGGQAGVLLFLHLLVVVQVADDPEHQRETENEQSPEVPPGNVGPADEQEGAQDAQDEHEPAHGRGTLLGHVPGGAVLLDGLAGLHPAEYRDQNLSGNGRYHEGHQRRDQ